MSPVAQGGAAGSAKKCGPLLNCQEQAAGPRKMRVALRYILFATAQRAQHLLGPLRKQSSCRINS